MNHLQTELKIYFEDRMSGQYSSAYRLPIVPDMTAAEVCDIIAEKYGKSNPHKYGLFTVVDEKMRWALQRSNKSAQRQHSTRFIAYRLRDL